MSHHSSKSNALLNCSLLDTNLDGPIIVGSGPLTDSAGRIKKYIRYGAGAIVGKTIYFGPDDDVVEKVYVDNNGTYNSTRYSKKTITEWLTILSALRKEKINVIPSLHAFTPELMGKLAQQVETTQCQMVELGIACPNDGSQQKISAKKIHAYTFAARQHLSAKLIVKLAASGDYLNHIQAALDAGADAISLSDTIPATIFDTKQRKFIFKGPAGYSGQAIKPIVLHAIYQARQAGFDCPIIGIGGVQSAEDVLEYLHVGANAVQIYTALMHNTPNLITSINKKLVEWCAQNNEKLASISHKNYLY